MRIAVIGQGPFGAQVMERLVQKGEVVVGAFTITGKGGDPIQEMADKLRVPVCRAPMKNEDTYLQYAKLKPELGVMAFVTDIVPVKILEYPRLGTIQYHPSLLPKHRGGSAINWPVIQGETKTGITIFWPDKGIDTGPILLQKEAAISPDDTVGSLYFNKLFPMGVEALIEAVDLVKRGAAPRIKQDESKATYEGLCDEKVAGIDWSKPSGQIYNLIRGTNPQPGAYTYLQGKKVKIFDSQLAGEKGEPGRVLAIDKSGIKIAAGDGAILVKRVQPEGAAKMDAAAYAASVNLSVGMKFGA